MNDTTNDQTDPRQEAAQRLVTVGMLQLHQLKRAMRPDGGSPWQDPSQGQGRVLAILKLQPEITQKELTFLLGMSRQALAELLAKLEKQGLIEREPSADDKRVVVVRLTEAGRAAEQTEQRSASASDELLDALDDDEVAQLNEYLGRVLEHVEQEWADLESRSGFERGPRGPFGRRGFPGFGGFPGFPGPGDWPGGRPGPRGPRGPHHGGPHGPHRGERHGPHHEDGPHGGADDAGHDHGEQAG